MYVYQNDQENERNNLVPHSTRFEPLRVMAIFATYLRARRNSEPVWFRGPKTSPKVPVIYGATSGGSNPKLMMTFFKACLPLNLTCHYLIVHVKPKYYIIPPL